MLVNFGKRLYEAMVVKSTCSEVQFPRPLVHLEAFPCAKTYLHHADGSQLLRFLLELPGEPLFLAFLHAYLKLTTIFFPLRDTFLGRSLYSTQSARWSWHCAYLAQKKHLNAAILHFAEYFLAGVQHLQNLVDVEPVVGADSAFHVNPELALRDVTQQERELIAYVVRVEASGITHLVV